MDVTERVGKKKAMNAWSAPKRKAATGTTAQAKSVDESNSSSSRKGHSRSLKRRKGPVPNMNHDPSQNDFFCDMCNGHQRVIYQLLSNYIPDEEDENYEAYYDNADNYRRQLEERYPLACARCLDKVQKKLTQQNYRIKSSLLNVTLSKSRGDRINPTRKYPTTGWLMAGLSWLLAHATLMSVEVAGIIGHSTLPNGRLIELPKLLARTAGGWALGDIMGAMLKFRPTASLPWSSSFGRLFVQLSEEELSAMIVVALIVLSIAGLYWNPLDFAAQKTPRIRIRTRQYFRWVQICAIPLFVGQFIGLFSLSSQQNPSWVHWSLITLHTLYLVSFLNGRYTLEPLDVRLDGSGGTHGSTTPKTSNADIMSPDNRHKDSVRADIPATSRSSTRTPDSSIASTNIPFPDFSTSSRTGSPNINEMNWSSRRSVSPNPTHLSAAFGTYRDSNNQPVKRDDAAFRTPSQLGSAGSLHGSQGLTPNDYHAGGTDNKFRLRAYEPSPLANPSMVTNMGLSNMSLGKMFGFPSATFHPPENHFAHRSLGRLEGQDSDVWSYRKAGHSGDFGQD
ncbi:hypothetical protein BGZ65_003020, partial [Modicella reniformis]